MRFLELRVTIVAQETSPMPEIPTDSGTTPKASTSSVATGHEISNEAEFLRRTFDRSINEMERSRGYFEKLLKHATWYVTTVTAVGFAFLAFLGFRSYSDIESR